MGRAMDKLLLFVACCTSLVMVQSAKVPLCETYCVGEFLGNLYECFIEYPWDRKTEPIAPVGLVVCCTENDHERLMCMMQSSDPMCKRNARNSTSHMPFVIDLTPMPITTPKPKTTRKPVVTPAPTKAPSVVPVKVRPKAHIKLAPHVKSNVVSPYKKVRVGPVKPPAQIYQAPSAPKPKPVLQAKPVIGPVAPPISANVKARKPKATAPKVVRKLHHRTADLTAVQPAVRNLRQPLKKLSMNLSIPKRRLVPKRNRIQIHRRKRPSRTRRLRLQSRLNSRGRQVRGRTMFTSNGISRTSPNILKKRLSIHRVTGRKPKAMAAFSFRTGF